MKEVIIMASVTLFHGPDKLVFVDTGHPHGNWKASEIHVHEVDLSKLTIAQLEELERQSRNGWIELHDWKRIPGAVTDRNPTSREEEQLRKFM